MDVANLLNTLCARLGYCLDPDFIERMIADPPRTVDAFTDAVVAAEGFDPDAMSTDQRREVRMVVAEAFGEPGRRPGGTQRGRPSTRRERS